MEKEWIVAHRVIVASQSEDGRIVECPAMQIRPGDFVDVTAQFEILTFGDQARGKQVRVYLNMSRVIKISSGDKREKVSDQRRVSLTRILTDGLSETRNSAVEVCRRH